MNVVEFATEAIILFNDDQYINKEVENILKAGMSGHNFVFRVKWRGISETSWHCEDLFTTKENKSMLDEFKSKNFYPANLIIKHLKSSDNLFYADYVPMNREPESLSYFQINDQNRRMDHLDMLHDEQVQLRNGSPRDRCTGHSEYRFAHFGEMERNLNGRVDQQWDRAGKALVSCNNNYLFVKFSSRGYLVETLVNKITNNFPSMTNDLSADVWRVFQYNRQKISDFQLKCRAREYLLNKINHILEVTETGLFGKLSIVGSTVNNCGTRYSDLDLNLRLPPSIIKQRGKKLELFETFQRYFQRDHRIDTGSIEVIRARVNLMKFKIFQENHTFVVDLTINNSEGETNSHFVHYMAKIDIRFPALVVVLKKWARAHNILDARDGSLNSYSIVLMTIHFFQSGVRPAIFPNIQSLFPQKFSKLLQHQEILYTGDIIADLPYMEPNNLSMGELVMRWFFYYDGFDFATYSINVRNGGVTKRTRSHSEMHIQDPFFHKNAASCVHRLEKIKRAISFGSDMCQNNNFKLDDIF